MASPKHGAFAPEIQLSRLFRDPFIRRAFERAERGNGDAFAVPVRFPVLSGGEAAHAPA
jgi:hypothetical protein